MATDYGSDIDWPAVRRYVLSLKSGNAKIVADDRYSKFRRMVRLLSQILSKAGASYSEHFRDRLIEISGEYNLSALKSARLAKLLAEAKSEYSVLSAWQSAATPSAAARALRDIEKSIQRVAKFYVSKEGPKRAALDYLGRAVSRQARNTPPETLHSTGIEKHSVAHPTAGEIYSDNCSDVLHRWFKLADLIQLALTSELQRLSIRQDAETAAKHAEWRVLSQEPTTPIVALVGGQLPRIYARITGEEFGRERHVERTDRPFDGLQDAHGMRFARLCLDAMGLGHYELETISRHYTEYRTAHRQDADREFH